MCNKDTNSTANRELVHGMLRLEEKVRRLFELDEERFSLDRKRIEIDERRRLLLKEIYEDQAARTPEAELAALSCYLCI